MYEQPAGTFNTHVDVITALQKHSTHIAREHTQFDFINTSAYRGQMCASLGAGARWTRGALRVLI